MTPDHLKQIKRRIIDYLHKYSKEAEVLHIAMLLNISTKEKEHRE